MTQTSPIFVSATRIRCAVTRPQGSWKWQKRGAISTYEWTGATWRFVARTQRPMRYDQAVAAADFIGRPSADRVAYRPALRQAA